MQYDDHEKSTSEEIGGSDPIQGRKESTDEEQQPPGTGSLLDRLVEPLLREAGWLIPLAKREEEGSADGLRPDAATVNAVLETVRPHRAGRTILHYESPRLPGWKIFPKGPSLGGRYFDMKQDWQPAGGYGFRTVRDAVAQILWLEARFEQALLRFALPDRVYNGGLDASERADLASKLLMELQQHGRIVCVGPCRGRTLWLVREGQILRAAFLTRKGRPTCYPYSSAYLVPILESLLVRLVQEKGIGDGP